MVVMIAGLTLVDFSRISYASLLIVALSVLATIIGLAVLLGVSPFKAAWASCIVIPFAGGIALFAPFSLIDGWSFASIGIAYRTGWPLIFDILFKAYASAYLVVIVMQSMSVERLIRALAGLKVPHIFIMLFTFLYRFTELFREQIKIMRDAARSRAPYLHGWRLLLFYGRMSGNLFVRAYERGEQIHAAMLARGYDGTLPGTQNSA
jgi:cobalt/nickel transport system permease protein